MSGGPANIHASLVAIGGRGVLLRGAARSGKSALALALCHAARSIGLEALLVADDRVDLTLHDGLPVGSPPARLAGLLEMSGVGLVQVPFLPSAPVVLVCDLQAVPERMPEAAVVDFMGIAIPAIAVPERAASLAAATILLLFDPETNRLEPRVAAEKIGVARPARNLE